MVVCFFLVIIFVWNEIDLSEVNIAFYLIYYQDSILKHMSYQRLPSIIPHLTFSVFSKYSNFILFQNYTQIYIENLNYKFGQHQWMTYFTGSIVVCITSLVTILSSCTATLSLLSNEITTGCSIPLLVLIGVSTACSALLLLITEVFVDLNRKSY